MKKMKISKIISLSIGILGFIMIFYSLAQGRITGAVIGVNSASKVLGIFGILLMIITIVIEKREFDKKR
jgi:hypothetical protein